MSNITHSYQRELIASENKTDFDKFEGTFLVCVV